MLKTDFTKLYKLQDKFLKFWGKLNLNFYLTGGTALGRFYLNHRYSEDLDFFVNADSKYRTKIDFILEEIKKEFDVLISQNIIYEDFARFFVKENDIILKLEFVNDIDYRITEPILFDFGYIDTPINILTNKLTAIISRDEPKDIFDIIHLSLKYCFNWKFIFYETKNKMLMNEIDLEQKINSFPIQLFDGLAWFIKEPNKNLYSEYIKTIANDFIIGADNSLCKTGINITEAKPFFY